MRGRLSPSSNEKAASPTGQAARPFIKWVGGKRQLLANISAHFPETFGTYHEPFVGGGAVFFHLRPQKAFLSDQNERLVRTYRGIRDDVAGVIKILKTYKNKKDFYLELRGKPVDQGTDAEVAAWFIFLNKTGFNGLYRVNSRNVFNVPFGNNAGKRFCDEENLRACSQALATTKILLEDFAVVLERAQKGDLVYFDPPYVPVSQTAFFTAYTSNGFGPKDHERLRDVALELKKRGVFVVLSNSSAALVKKLYAQKFKCLPVSATRLVNSNTEGRGKVTELLIV